MKHQLFSLLVAIFIYTKLQAQCPPDITLSTQAQINSFPTDFPGCTAIPGNMTIGGTEITNLNGLIGLASVGGNLTIDSNIMLSNLTGLNSLKAIGGDLAITKNHALLSLNGLNNLASVGGSLYIGKGIGNPFQTSSNDLLTNLNGLESLDSVGGDFFIKDNASLVNLNGIENIAFIGGEFAVVFNGNLIALANLRNLHTLGEMEIFSNPSLSSLSGLDSIRSISGGVLIWGTSSLTNLTGLNGLDSIGGTLTIMANSQLVDLNGLNNLRFIGGSLNIFAFFGTDPNDVLTSLDGLESINFIGGDLNISDNPVLSDITALDHPVFIGGNLHISNNPLLSVCAVKSICNYLDDPSGAVTINTNAPGCNFPTEVLAVCKGFSNVIQGTLFWDDGNCLYDSTEQTLPQWLVKAESDSLTFYAVTDTTGHFSILVDTGAYALSAQMPNGLWTLCDTVHLAFDQFYQSLDTAIGVLATEECPLLNVDIATNFLRRCFDNFYHVSYCNEGTAAADSAYVVLTFDPMLEVDTSSLPGLWADLGSNTFSIALGEVLPLTCGSFSVKVTVDCNAPLGETKCAMAHIFPDSVCQSPPNWDGSDIVVTARCLSDTVFFTIKNVGDGDMEQLSRFIIIENVVLRYSGEFQLDTEDEITIPVKADGQTWRMEAAEHPEHPFSKVASVSIEGCPDFEPPSFFLQFPQNESRPFAAKDCHPVIGSWDPNDKQAFPKGLGVEHNIRDDTPLEYLIRFQNTGTDTAFRVVVRDTLSPYIDIETVRPGASSHPYRFEIVSGNVLKFTFDDIMLPDSNVNEAASNGFVQFSVRQKSAPANPPGRRIENKAAIYFDFNAPVLTNTVFHTVAMPITSIRRDTICDPAAADLFLTDTAQYSYFEVVHETFLSDTLYTLLDTTVNKGDTLYGAVVLENVVLVKTLKSINGCDSILVIKITVPTTEPNDVLPFQLYPNPTSGDLTLRFISTINEEITSIELHDATGQFQQMLLPIFAGNSNTFLTLPISRLSDGVYFLTIRSPNRTWVGRFVKLN